MKIFTSLSILALLLIPSFLVAQNAGIPISYFPTANVQGILSIEGCAGVRVYPANSQNQGKSTMIIGIDGQGNEIGTNQYVLYTGISDNRATTANLAQDAAASACQAYSSKNSPFVVDFSASAISALLPVPNAGVSFRFSTENGNNFIAEGYSDQGEIHPTGNAVPGDPCPTACGDPAQYLCAPN